MTASIHHLPPPASDPAPEDPFVTAMAGEIARWDCDHVPAALAVPPSLRPSLEAAMAAAGRLAVLEANLP
jgi:hypothetical protein